MVKNEDYMINKTRREWFGGLVFREKPGFVGYVDDVMADRLKIIKDESFILPKNLFSTPMDAHFALTTRCNLFCEGCYNTKPDDGIMDIPLYKAKKVINNLAKLNLFSVSFGGGEPTLHPDLFEIARYTREQNILPNITTNGRTITLENASEFAVFGNVHLSLHALKDIPYIEHAAALIIKLARIKPGLNLLLTTETVPELVTIFKWAKKNKFSKILCLRYKQTDKNKEISHLQIDESTKDVYQKINLLKKQNKMKVLVDCSMFQDIAKYGSISHDQMYKVDFNGCQGANAYIAIDVNGSFKPCSFWKETMGNAETLTQDFWINDAKLNAFRNYRDHDSCVNCGYLDLCGGGCRLDTLHCSYI